MMLLLIIVFIFLVQNLNKEKQGEEFMSEKVVRVTKELDCLRVFRDCMDGAQKVHLC